MSQDTNEQHRQSQLAQALQDRFERISPEVFADFLTSHGVAKLTCPICYHDDMAIPQVSVTTVGPDGSDQKTYISCVKINGDNSSPYSLLNYQYRVICKNCGFTSSFAVHPVILWSESQGDFEGDKG
jgi:transcription elongation factor Elf1